MLITISNMSKLLSSSIMYVNKGTFNLRQLMWMMIRLQEHKKQEFLIIFLNYGHPMFMTNKIRNQYQIFEFKVNILWVIFLSYFVKKKKLKSMTPMNSFLTFIKIWKVATQWALGTQRTLTRWWTLVIT